MSGFGVAMPLLLFLKYMQHENRLPEFDGVGCSVRVTLVMLDDLQDTRAPKAFKNFGCVVLISALGKVQSMTKKLADAHWQSH